MKEHLSHSSEDIKDAFVSACESLYGPLNHDAYFCAKNKSENEVANEILSAISNPEFAKKEYLTMTLYIFQTEDDVFIMIS